METADPMRHVVADFAEPSNTAIGIVREHIGIVTDMSVRAFFKAIRDPERETVKL